MDTQISEGLTIAGKYRVLRRLGAGGMGEVLLAMHMQLDQMVAIKLMGRELATNAEAGERFLREARAAARIQNDHVVRVFDVATLEDGRPYIVMEYLEGEDLSQRLERGPLPIDEAVDYVLQACTAIAEAHRVGIVHRDLKPGNLFLARRRDGTSTVKVVDFGISKVASTAERQERALTTTLMGSPFYMSPEQLRGDADVDGRADIWALGIVLFELLTAEGAFDAPTMPQLCLRIMSEPPRRASELRADLPPQLDAVIERCLQRDRAARFADVGALVDALAPFAPQKSHPRVVIVPTAAPRKRSAAMAWIAGGGLLATFVAMFALVRALSSHAAAPIATVGTTSGQPDQTVAVTSTLTESPADPSAPTAIASTTPSPIPVAARVRPPTPKRVATVDDFGGRK